MTLQKGIPAGLDRINSSVLASRAARRRFLSRPLGRKQPLQYRSSHSSLGSSSAGRQLGTYSSAARRARCSSRLYARNFFLPGVYLPDMVPLYLTPYINKSHLSMPL